MYSFILGKITSYFQYLCLKKKFVCTYNKLFFFLPLNWMLKEDSQCQDEAGGIAHLNMCMSEADIPFLSLKIKSHK